MREPRQVPSESLLAAAQKDALAAAKAAAVEVAEVAEVEDLAAVVALFARVWETPIETFQLGTEVLRALAHAGNYVAVARDGEGLAGASLGFLGMHGGSVDLHSHITAVRPGATGGTGFALKLHQRAWALERGITRVQWTFDPLVRRNAYFNLAKLGATVVAYHPDFYGSMGDGVNKGDESDRCVAQWDLDGDRVAAALSGAAPGADANNASVLLDEQEGKPVVQAAADGQGSVRCRLPDDILAIRATDPELARLWRIAVRETAGAAIASGYRATAMTRDGWMVLER